MIQLQCINRIIKEQDSSWIILNNLDESFFSDYKQEFSFIKNHLDNYGKVPDQVTFLAKFPEFDVLEVNEHPRFLLDELYKDKNMRYLASTFNRVKGLLQEKKVEEAMLVYTKASEQMSSGINLEAVDIFENTSRYEAFIERATDFSKFYVTSGFKELDDVIGGWDRQEELATIMARPNVGKSWILLKVAIAAAERGLTVGIYSGEMSENKVGYRVDTLISHISNTKLIHGNRDVQNDYKMYLDSIKDNMKGTIKVITPSMINGPAGVSALRAFIDKYKLDMLCIDQHSLLDDDNKARDPVVKASNISRDLKNLQVMKKIPIIAVSQANREIDEHGMDLKNIAQADRIGQDSTVVLGLEHKDQVLTMHLLKSRDSVNGKSLKYALDFDKGIFQYIPADVDAKGGTDCEELKNKYSYDNYEGEEAF